MYASIYAISSHITSLLVHSVDGNGLLSNISTGCRMRLEGFILYDTPFSWIR